MRVAILMSVASPWAREVAMKLASLGAEVHVIDFASSAPDGYMSHGDEFQAAEVIALRTAVAGVEFLRTPAAGPSRHFLAVPAVRRILAKLRPDHLLTLYGGGFANIAWLSGFRPYVVYVVGSDVLLMGGLRALLSRHALGSAALVLANGRYLAERARALRPGLRVEALYLGVDTDELKPSDPVTEPRILCTRGFLPVYNNEYLLQALALLGDDAPPNLQVTFAAPGPDLVGAQALADRILSPALRARVAFRNGLDRKTLFAEYRRSQVYVSLSRSDGTSVALMEALAAGIFPVLSDIPQNREWVSPREDNGILVPFERPEILARALTRALRDSGMRARAASYNRQQVVDRADSSRNMKALLGILEATGRQDTIAGRFSAYQPVSVDR